MNRKEAFTILGLHEDAEKTEIDKAYKNWLRKYSAADYADDPDYVRRKKILLREAYSLASGHAPAVKTYEHHDHDHDLPFDEEEHGSCTIDGDSDGEDNPFEELGKAFAGFKTKLEKDVKSRAPRITPAKPAKQRAKNPDSKLSKKFLSIISIVLLISSFGSLFSDDSDDMDYDYETTYFTEQDEWIHDMSGNANDLLWTSERDEGIYSQSYEEDELQEAADQFTAACTSGEYSSIDEWAEYLASEYEELESLQYYDLEGKMNQLLDFYSFTSLDDAIGRTNPYNFEIIDTYPDYLNYLVKVITE